MLSAKSLKRYGIAIGLGAIATMVPVSVSTSGEAQINDACADGVCCKELGSLCVGAMNFYYSLSRCNIRITSAPANEPPADTE